MKDSEVEAVEILPDTPDRPYPGARLHYRTSEQHIAVGEQLHIWAGNTRITLVRNRAGVHVSKARHRAALDQARKP